ncbi:MAG TPA: SPFH domain-containing protein [Chthoniobacter sp.]|nr:SPFH domain-containing protein [Chthoniobacter sp.]
MDGIPVLFSVLYWVVILGLTIIAVYWLAGVRYIPHRRVGILEKLWSERGSLAEGRIIALAGEAGFQARVLRGGLHFGYPFWMYSVHTVPLVTIAEGRIGYVYARDGHPLVASQTLGSLVECNGFQDPVAFLTNNGQRGRQRAILREGVYAINTALFVVITEQGIHAGPVSRLEREQCASWQQELENARGFSPVLVGSAFYSQRSGDTAMQTDASKLSPHDLIGIITVHDGPTLDPGEFIAPQVGGTNAGGHNYFQDPDTFLAFGGRRGKQLQVLTDGTYFINRWFATVELQPKTLIPIGYVGVVISYYGASGEDVTGAQFRYGEQVESGRRGVWRDALPPGKYALNPYALKVEVVPTVNFVLRWITGQTEAHRYDEELASIPLITADGYEPLLPLSLVLHIDYAKAPRVVQRFGDVRRLITQTLDPILTAYFRDVAQSSNMLDLLTHREEIQRHATEELGRRFQTFDINCVAVLIGRPETGTLKPGQEDPIDRLFDQLRQRRLAEEQKATFAKQQEAAVQQQQLNHAQAEAERQTQLTQTRVEIEIAGNRGAAQLAEAERLAKRDIALAEGRARSAELEGQGEAAKVAQIGQAEANVSRQKVEAFTDPRLYALSLVSQQLAHSEQPLVPERVVLFGQGGDGKASAETGLFQSLMQVLTTWQTMGGFDEMSKTPGAVKVKPASAKGEETKEIIRVS